ncbi:UDP-glucose 4-epimerase [Bacillus canaveralius]|uniref:UDP-glucose 4-epimerase n=1 Tax=Bacillus canaveralius TaxID=1403243 RepID=A0A2N5GKS8_9BACI|nr:MULTISPECIES: NAD-dependent epimerase/dehydratase family protein [Bacillus]PLR82111.1 UDP-glucose 4-epimerase [Bacillus canaveralius]PLR83938.1 UDP-glucose 4-epimerase [Bacillus sp. V33-4]PLR97983.1 UDP-glucose 4-epimerase [Bacillus canaveralius]RSK54436.1 NAD-dependent epimerase/dehydratase family protein [Bacillus canaveralius]
MKVLITGAAGFIGSHLCELLVNKQEVEKVTGIDCFIGPTPAALKEDNIKPLNHHDKFKLIKDNLLTMKLENVVAEADVVYHLAAIPGVRSSWGEKFSEYTDHNILATQRLLEACKDTKIEKFVYASTSSIYGEMEGRVGEDHMPSPLSPYGITKLGGEHLCRVYQQFYQIPTVILRYFTVYGPRQRPDMAFNRFIHQLIRGEPLTVYGDGMQTRDFTYINDCARATAAVIKKDNMIGETINIGGKERSSVLEIISSLEEISGKKAKLVFLNQPSGEPRHTWADISRAKTLLQYNPLTTLQDGLEQEYQYFLTRYRDGSL